MSSFGPKDEKKSCVVDVGRLPEFNESSKMNDEEKPLLTLDEIRPYLDEYGFFAGNSKSATDSLNSDLNNADDMEIDPDKAHLFGGFESETSWEDSGMNGGH